MSGVAEHYERVLSPVYAWMTGGAEAALAAGKSEIEALNLPLAAGSLVVDRPPPCCAWVTRSPTCPSTPMSISSSRK